jgi:hypothetical protein
MIANGRIAFHRVAEGDYEGEYSENPENTANPCEHCDLCEHCDSVKSAEWALSAARPTGAIHTDHDFRLAVFNLAKHFKAVAELRDRTVAALRPLVKQWYESAAEELRGRTLTDTYALFGSSWKVVRDPAGDDVVKRAWDIAQIVTPPPEAAMYDDVRVRRLITLCRQLQFENARDNRRTGFYLSGRKAAKLLGVTQPTAALWLAMLVDDGILEVTDAGGGFSGGRRKARSYRYRPDPRE